MKTMFLMGAALAAAIATPASAQLLGGGGLTGGLGGSLSGGISGNLGGDIDRTVAPIRDRAETTARTARRARSVRAEPSRSSCPTTA